MSFSIGSCLNNFKFKLPVFPLISLQFCKLKLLPLSSLTIKVQLNVEIFPASLQVSVYRKVIATITTLKPAHTTPLPGQSGPTPLQASLRHPPVDSERSSTAPGWPQTIRKSVQISCTPVQSSYDPVLDRFQPGENSNGLRKSFKDFRDESTEIRGL
jgi:hypothetical protein